MNCPNCNKEINDNSKFCSNCGIKIELTIPEYKLSGQSLYKLSKKETKKLNNNSVNKTLENRYKRNKIFAYVLLIVVIALFCANLVFVYNKKYKEPYLNEELNKELTYKYENLKVQDYETFKELYVYEFFNGWFKLEDVIKKYGKEETVKVLYKMRDNFVKQRSFFAAEKIDKILKKIKKYK